MIDLLPELLAALLAAAALSLGGFDLLRRVRGRPRKGAVFSFLAAVNDRRVPRRHLDRIDGALRMAGKPRDLRAAELIAWMEVTACGSLVAGAAFARWLDLGPGACAVVVLLGAGYPLLWLRDKVKARHRAILRALPYDLDLLTLSVEAGLDFAAALAKVVEKGRKGPLASELGIALKELKLGKTREDALRNLGQRVGLPALSAVAQALVQADRMGTPLGKVLRILATQMRMERTQRAEKLANEAPVKLLLPLIGCIFPTIFLMLFGPIAFQVLFGGSY